MTVKTLKIILVFIVFTFSRSVANEGTYDSARVGIYMRIADDYFNALAYDSSGFYYQKAGEITKSENTPTYLNSQIGLANSLLRKGEIVIATEILINAEQYAGVGQYSRSVEIGTIMNLLGYCYLSREEIDAADRYVNKGRNILIESIGENNDKVASSYYTSAVVQKAKGNYEAAIVFLEQALTIQKSVPGISKSTLANSYTVMGTLFDDKNEFDRAIIQYQKADSLLRSVGLESSSQAASCYLNLSSSFNNRGEYESAILYGKRVIKIYTALSLPEHANVASALSKLGEIYTNLGDYDKAAEYFTRSLAIFSSKYPDKRSAVGVLYQRLGDVYNKIGDLDKAIVYSEKGMKIYEQVFGEYHPQAGFMYELLADVYLKMKQYDNAVTYYQKALASRYRVTGSTSRIDIAFLHTSLANTYILSRQYDSAQVHLQAASDVEKRSGEKNILQSSLLQQRYGDFYIGRMDYFKALQCYHSSLCILALENGISSERSIPAIDHSIYKKEILELLKCKASAFESIYSTTGHLDDERMALAHYRKAMDVLDELRKQYSSDASKFYLTETGSMLYRNACRIALILFDRTNDPLDKESAFLIADRSKGNILMERLSDSEAKHFAGIPDSLLNYERDLLSAIARYETQMTGTASAGHGMQTIQNMMISDVQSKYLEARRKHRELIELFEQQYPQYYSLKYARYTLSVKELQTKLQPNTVVMEYLVNENEIYLFTVSKKNVTVKTLKNAAAIQNLTRRFSTSLKTFDSETYCSVGFSLYSSIVRPVEAVIGHAEKILIIPDGYLYYIPFEALPINRYTAHPADFSIMKYIVTEHEISYAYSAAFDLKLNGYGKKDLTTLSSFVGFAPVFKDTMKNGDFFANRSYVEQSGISDVRSITLDGKTFNELKYSENEVTSIESTLKPRSVATKNYLYDEATEKNFKSAAPQYDIIHIATHGFINEKDPKFSAILFSQPKNSSEDEDGILYVNETFNLNLKAQLVVLSSCESGIGTLVDGEGMIALSRGLFYAGAKNIIFSLWKISDKQTYLLMEEFYKNIAAGKTYSSSLRSAKLSMIRSKESAFPGKWSGFVLIGQ